MFDPRILALSLALTVPACATLPGAVTEEIDHRRVEYVLTRRDNGPPVVFENGLGGRLDWWAKVYPVIAGDSSAFAYNRPGVGHSDPVTSPRDGAHIVDELRGLLRSKALTPPYILVGHSLGGLYMQYYARRYPEEVAGVVLVDSTHPAQLKNAGSPEHWPGWFRLMLGVAMSSVDKQELDALTATGDSLLALPPRPGRNVIVLSATESASDSSDQARDAHDKRADIPRLFPGATQIWVDGGHGIPLEHPEVVIEAIRTVQRGARGATASDRP